MPLVLQRLEGAALFIVATLVYFGQGFDWLAYIILLFAFDISMLGYVINTRFGALLYNFGHSLVCPLLLVAVYLFVPSSLLAGLICLWLAHIGLDRALGYGLKFTTRFTHTHLGDIGKA